MASPGFGARRGAERYVNMTRHTRKMYFFAFYTRRGERTPVLNSWRRASYSRESRTLIPKRFLKTEVLPFRESYAHELIALAVKYTLIRQKTEKLHGSVDK